MATSLYRKYRPRGFDGVVGQQHITGTLINQIKKDRVGHAYLFTGSRGTGKTTCAKIFARAINCASPEDGSPCGKCEACKALENSSNLDVMEIDAASNNGVEDAREIREHVKYPPVVGKYKVYIIDEVHMLSGSAFNALLKTIEEPPPHAVFILATTEVHKLPATILSRCMRFDFRLVSVDEIAALIGNVYRQEGKEFEPEAVRFIASLGEGSVRDALSVADMCLNCSDGKLTYGDVLAVTGASDRSKIRALMTAVRAGDYGACFDSIDELSRLGKSMSLVAKELAAYARDLLVLKTTAKDIVIETPENLEIMRGEAAETSADLLAAAVQIFSAADTELRYSVSPKIALETAALRACKLGSSDLSALEERIRRLESGSAVMSAPVSAAPAVQSAAPAAPDIARPMDAKSIWGRMTTYMRTNESMRLYTLIGGHHDFEIKDGNLIVWATSDNYLEMSEAETQEAIHRALKADGVDLCLVVDKRKDTVDMDNEIDKIKKLMGGAKLNIQK